MESGFRVQCQCVETLDCPNPVLTVAPSIDGPDEVDNDYNAALDHDVPELPLEAPALHSPLLFIATTAVESAKDVARLAKEANDVETSRFWIIKWFLLEVPLQTAAPQANAVDELPSGLRFLSTLYSIIHENCRTTYRPPQEVLRVVFRCGEPACGVNPESCVCPIGGACVP